jgi:hypothetical protein
MDSLVVIALPLIVLTLIGFIIAAVIHLVRPRSSRSDGLRTWPPTLFFSLAILLSVVRAAVLLGVYQQEQRMQFRYDYSVPTISLLKPEWWLRQNPNVRLTARELVQGLVLLTGGSTVAAAAVTVAATGLGTCATRLVRQRPV